MFELKKHNNHVANTKEYNEDIDLLHKYVDLYTTFPKPKGKNNASVINECTRSIMRGIRTLIKNDRYDVVSEILEKLRLGQLHLRGPNYCSWIMIIMKNIYYKNSKECAIFFLIINLLF